MSPFLASDNAATLGGTSPLEGFRWQDTQLKAPPSNLALGNLTLMDAVSSDSIRDEPINQALYKPVASLILSRTKTYASQSDLQLLLKYQTHIDRVLYRYWNRQTVYDYDAWVSQLKYRERSGLSRQSAMEKLSKELLDTWQKAYFYSLKRDEFEPRRQKVKYPQLSKLFAIRICQLVDYQHYANLLNFIERRFSTDIVAIIRKTADRSVINDEDALAHRCVALHTEQKRDTVSFSRLTRETLEDLVPTLRRRIVNDEVAMTYHIEGYLLRKKTLEERGPYKKYQKARGANVSNYLDECCNDPDSVREIAQKAKLFLRSYTNTQNKKEDERNSLFSLTPEKSLKQKLSTVWDNTIMPLTKAYGVVRALW